MQLNELWFVLVAVLFTGFFFLEGFDFGVGMATRWLGKDDGERRIIINTIGPFWDANEVWLITAAGAIFAAFPHWYATMFSGFYTLFTLILLALIVRGVAFEFRGKVDGSAWKGIWDGAIWIGSAFPPFLLAMVFAALFKGVPIGEGMVMNAQFSDFVNGYTVLAGVTIVGLCWLHGLLFLSLRTEGRLRERALEKAKKWLPWQSGLLAVLVIWTFSATDLFDKLGGWLIVVLFAGVITLLLAWFFLNKGREGWGFAMAGIMFVLLFVTLFAGLFPRLMVSSLGDAFDLTIYNAASGDYTLRAMTIVAAVLLPFVLAYQAWSYFVFHKRITKQDHLEY